MSSQQPDERSTERAGDGSAAPRITTAVLSEPEPPTLPRDHPTGIAFIDETGAIADDRIFAVGCLTFADPAPVLREIQHLRDHTHWYREIHWSELTRNTVDLYRGLAEIVIRSDHRFSCIVADRSIADPLADSNPWTAYETLATELVVGAIDGPELISVVADAYSTPPGVRFEHEVRHGVNERLGRLAAVSVCRFDSRSCDPLQAVDLLTGAIAFEFRQRAGLAGTKSQKSALAAEVRAMYGIGSVLEGIDSDRMKVSLYRAAGTPARG